MATSVELQLLSKIIETKDLRAALDYGLTSEMFLVHENRLVFEYIWRHYHSDHARNIVPGWDIIDKEFESMSASFPDADPHYTVVSLAHRVRVEWLKKKIEGILDNASDDFEDDPHECLNTMVEECKALQTVSSVSRDIILSDSMRDIRNEYILARDATGYLGIPFPVGWGYHDENGKPKILQKTQRQHHPLNEESRGMQKGDFILLYGRPKSMKTWLLIDAAVECYQHHNCRVMIFTKEMTPEQMRTRFVARMLAVDYMNFRNGQLSKDEEDDFFDLVDWIKDEEERNSTDNNKRDKSLLITTGWAGKNAGGGLASLQSKIDLFEPDIVFVDSVYLMEAAKGSGKQAKWQDIAEIAYGLSNMASNYQIPILATSQANRSGEQTKGSTMAEIAYGDTFAQACHLAIRVIKTEKEGGDVDLACVISGAREIKLPGFLLSAEPAIRFQLKQIFESQRQIQAQFKAEEDAMAREEEAASKRMSQERALPLREMRKHFKKKGA
jgi:hypothetical protein